MEKNNPIEEAERYVENARKLLSEKAEKQGDYYNDRKYVKMAGNTAWNGVLVALDAALGIRDKMKKGQRPDFNDYKKSMVEIDKKAGTVLQAAYDSLHKAMGYDGIQNYKIVQESLKEADHIIDWCRKKYKP